MTEPLAYDDSGVGEPAVLLVHGVGSSRAAWDALVSLLDKRVIRVDLPGSGATPGNDDPLDLDDIADRVVATLDAAGATSVDAVGHSLGAAVVTTLAAAAPGRVRSLALVSGWARSDDSLRRALAGDPDDPAVLAALTPEERAVLGSFEWAPGTASQKELAGRVDVRPSLARLGCPVLVVHADDDRVVAPGLAETLASVAGVAVTRLPGGHSLPLDRPADLARVLDTFWNA